MTIPKISQSANAAAERYFAMRRNAPDHADRSLAEVIQGACEHYDKQKRRAMCDPAQFTPRKDHSETIREWTKRAIEIAIDQ